MKAFLIRSLQSGALRLAMLALALGRAAASLALLLLVFLGMTQYLRGALDRADAAILAGAAVGVLIVRWLCEAARLAILRRYFVPTINGFPVQQEEDRYDPRVPYSGCDGPTQFNIFGNR